MFDHWCDRDKKLCINLLNKKVGFIKIQRIIKN